MRIGDTFRVNHVLLSCADIPCENLNCLDCPFRNVDEFDVRVILRDWAILKAKDATSRRLAQSILFEKPSTHEELERIINDFMKGTDDDC